MLWLFVRLSTDPATLFWFASVRVDPDELAAVSQRVAQQLKGMPMKKVFNLFRKVDRSK